MGIISLFDEVNTSLLNRNYSIDKNVFWSYSKLFALRATNAPCMIFDLDYRIFGDIRELGFFNQDVGAYSIENINGKFYYWTPDKCLENLDVPKNFDWDNFAINVSSLYFKDNEFKNLYCDWVINYMYEWTFKHQGDEADYTDSIILFAEQYMLNQLIKKYNKKIALIIDDGQEAPLPPYGVSIGLNAQNYTEYVYHYGRLKKTFDKNSEQYDLELRTIHGYANYKIENKEHLSILNDIYENPKYERYFR